MEKDLKKTKVIFRKFKKDGDIIALFPYEIQNHWGNILSYMHIGQHGDADYQQVVSMTSLASEEEYLDLKKELENLVGYNLIVIKKIHYSTFKKKLC